MRAMRCERFGGPEVLAPADVPDPVAGRGETLVEVAAAGVNFGDIKQIAGEHTDGTFGRVATPRRPSSPTVTWSRCRRG
jgi:NADPH2:quinone reductase